MKKQLLLAALAVTALTGCQKEGEVDNETIRVSANVVNIPTSKAPIGENEGEVKTFLPMVLGWEAASGVNPDYTTAPSWTAHTDKAVSVIASDNSEFLMDPSQTYKYGKITHLFSFFPDGTCLNGVVTFTGIAVDGTTDILIADKVNGSLATKVGPLVYKHPLTQFKFVVKSTGKNHSATLTGITLKDVALPMSVNIADGAMSYQTDANLNVPGIANVPITVAGNKCGNPVMVKPLTGATIPLIIKTSEAGGEAINVTATVDGGKIEANTAYTITLTFVGDNEIKANASVQNWSQGTGGGAVS